MLENPSVAGIGDQVAGRFKRLHAVDGRLHLVVEILYAQAEAVEAQAAQRFQVPRRGYARVDFDADFGLGSKRKGGRGESKQIFHLFWGQVCGRAAAPMELHDFARARDEAPGVLDLMLEGSQVSRHLVMVLGDDHVARAKQAEALAKREVHVQGDRRARLFRLFVGALQIVGAEILFPNRRRGIAGVARAGAIVFREKLLRNLESLAVEREADLGIG